MSDFNSNDPGVSDAARNNPITRATEVIADWIEDNPRDRKVIVGLGTALAIALVAILVLANRPAEQVVTEVAVPVKASLVAVTVSPAPPATTNQSSSPGHMCSVTAWSTAMDAAVLCVSLFSDPSSTQLLVGGVTVTVRV